MHRCSGDARARIRFPGLVRARHDISRRGLTQCDGSGVSAEIRTGDAGVKLLGVAAWQPMILALLAEALTLEGDFPVAEAALKGALTASDHNDERRSEFRTRHLDRAATRSEILGTARDHELGETLDVTGASS